jgi:hypothetical protein
VLVSVATPPPLPPRLDGIDVRDLELAAVAGCARLDDGSVAPAELWRVLGSVDAAALGATERLELVAAWQRLESAAAARRLDSALSFATSGAPAAEASMREFADDEIALRLSVSRRTASRDLTTAVVLNNALPRVRSAFQQGSTDLVRATLVAEACIARPQRVASGVQAEVIGALSSQNPAALRKILQRAVVKADPDGAMERHRRAHDRRRVSGTPAQDGMADLHAHLSGHDWVVISSALNAAARGQKAAGDPRTLDQLRADALVAPFLKALHTGVLDGLDPFPLARHHGALPTINVTVPASVLMGASQAPGDLDGYGAIPAEAARAMAADGQWRRILTDPSDGKVVDVGTTRYAPPASMDRLVEQRDRTCRFPGCTARSDSCDLDHTRPFPHGPTAADNLGALCRRHHRLKHEGAGVALVQEDGTFTWRMPSGRTYTVEPPPLTPFDDPLSG